MNNMDMARKFLNLKCIGIDKSDHLYRVDGRTCDDIEETLVINLDGHSTFYNVFGNKNLLSKSDILDIYNGSDKTNEFNFREIRIENWCYFNSIPDYSSGLLASVVENLNKGHEFDEFCLMVNGWPTSRAWSIRTNDESSEAAVETRLEYRQVGHGKAVLFNWISRQFELNKIAFYCYRQNYQSQRLAQSMGAINICRVISCHK